jgi:hypothetical protein
MNWKHKRRVQSETIMKRYGINMEHAEAWFFEALCCKPESGCTMALGSTQPLTEMSTRNLPGGKGRPTLKADKLTAICGPKV